MTSCILWTIRAERRMRATLAECQADEVTMRMSHVRDCLAAAFPRQPVVIGDHYSGYRSRSDRHILQVEICDGPQRGTYVVKIGPRDDMDRECAGWDDCRPVGLRSDLVLLPLRQIDDGQLPEEIRDTHGVLIYGDAQQFIGVESTTHFEHAVLRAVRYGLPTVDSIGDVLVQVYERLGHLLYSSSHEVEVSPAELFDEEHLKLADSIAQWQNRLLSVRTDVHAACPPAPDRFIDPIDYLDAVRQAAGEQSEERDNSAASRSEWADRRLGLLRGHAHGDLHGRNILVGEVRERVLWPTVFDYEHMGRRNLLGWDFVKMETELKIRAYHTVFRMEEHDYIRAVQEVEADLARQTEANYHDYHTWQASIDAYLAEDTPAGRLKAIIMQIRHLAACHLGRDRNRVNRWLEEYYTLLALYSVHAGRFENLTRRESIALLLSGGVALSRTSTFQRISFSADDVTHRTELFPSYHLPLERGRLLLRSAEEQDRAEAVDLYRRLWEQYPHGVPIAEELVHALFVQGDRRAGIRVLEGLMNRLRSPSEELFCRYGKHEKLLGIELLAPRGGKPDEGDLREARRHFENAEVRYMQAYEIRRGHFPGINVATLRLYQAEVAHHLGDEERTRQLTRDAQEFADRLLTDAANWPVDRTEDRTLWHPATRGEAALIAGQPDRAIDHYRAAMQSAEFTNGAGNSIRPQAARLIKTLLLLKMPVPDESARRDIGL